MSKCGDEPSPSDSGESSRSDVNLTLTGDVGSTCRDCSTPVDSTGDGLRDDRLSKSSRVWSLMSSEVLLFTNTYNIEIY